MPEFEFAYIIYSADVLAETSRFIEEMSPSEHMPAGYREDSAEYAERKRIAAKFEVTEGDEQYDYGYLAEEHGGNAHYFPAGYTDREGLEEADDDTPDDKIGRGYHRKWVGEITADEWVVFADAYNISLDARGIPEDYENTLGSMTPEHGTIPAVSVDNTHGWNDYSDSRVIDSTMYISFGGHKS